MAIGFEFQTAVTLRTEEKFVRTTPLQNGGSWRIVPDEIEQRSGHQTADLEYVTNPYSVDDSAKLESVMGAVVASARNLKVDQRIGIATVTGVEDPVTAAPQVTIGIPLDRIGQLAAASRDDIFTGITLDQDTMPTLFGMTGEDGATGGGLVRAAELAATAVGAVAGNNAAAYADVQGLLTLLLNYLASSVSTRGRLEYAKLLTPVMSRTNFHAMYLQVEQKLDQLLGREQDAYWDAEHFAAYWTTKGPERPFEKAKASARADTFAKFVLTAAAPLRVDADLPVFPGGYGTPDLPGKRLMGPSRRAWLLSVSYPEYGATALSMDAEAERKDYLTRLESLQDFRKVRTDLLSPAPYASSSLGLRTTPFKQDRFKVLNPFEGGGRVILELRRLPKGTPADEWPAYAEAVRAAVAGIVA
jgi:hypothetical protein